MTGCFVGDFVSCLVCSYPHPPWVGCMPLHPASRPAAATPTHTRLRLTQQEWAELLRNGRVTLASGLVLEVDGA